MDADKLKPCPFCGGEAKHRSWTDEHEYPHHIIECTGCGSGFEYMDYANSYAAWNRRAVDLEALAVEIGSLIPFTARDSFNRGMNTAYRKAAAIVRAKANGNNKEDDENGLQ